MVMVLCIFYSFLGSLLQTGNSTGKPNDIYGLPDLKLGDPRWISAINGTRVLPSTDTTVVIYTSSECPIARKYRPELRRLSVEFGEKQVQWRYVYAPEDKGTAKANFQAAHVAGIPVFEPDYRLAKACSVRVTPTALVFDSRGKLRYRGRIDDRTAVMGEWKTHATRRDLYLAISEVVAGKKVTRPQTDANGCFLPFVVEN
jgi:hypothetical protein